MRKHLSDNIHTLIHPSSSFLPILVAFPQNELTLWHFLWRLHNHHFTDFTWIWLEIWRLDDGNNLIFSLTFVFMMLNDVTKFQNVWRWWRHFIANDVISRFSAILGIFSQCLSINISGLADQNNFIFSQVVNTIEIKHIMQFLSFWKKIRVAAVNWSCGLKGGVYPWSTLRPTGKTQTYWRFSFFAESK